MLRKVWSGGARRNTTTRSTTSANEIRNTVKYLYSRVGSPVHVGQQTFLTALNAITSMLWGVTIQGQERASIRADFQVVVADSMELLGKPNLLDFFLGLARFDLQGLKKQLLGIVMRFNRIFDAITDKRTKIGGW
ncbi:Cytochrome P450 76M5 [Camellia lanceoleosa]|uniref:Cytochrome P450 76M5 n=1 Tax=Camellia lanceoleosa TaxID=1840588 RepID=A0ACC0G4P4_9ERIC|nr:Cytochrome P450 76M5 [Camellia lanceoleosa]